MAMTDHNLKAIQRRRAAIAGERQALDNEEAELIVAERVIMRLAGIEAPLSVAAPKRVRARSGRNQADMVTSVMSDGRLWWDQKSIAEAVEMFEGVTIKHSSLQPLLSKMKAAAEIVRGPEGYALASRLIALGDEADQLSIDPQFRTQDSDKSKAPPFDGAS